MKYSHPVFQSTYTVLHSYEQYVKIPPYPNCYQYLSVFFYYSHPSECEVISCGFDGYFSDDQCSCLKKCFLRFFAILNWVICFSYWVLRVLKYSKCNSIIRYRISKSSLTLYRFFSFSWCFWSTSLLFSCPLCFCLSFAFVACVYSVILKKSLRLTAMFSSKGFIVLTLTFRSLIHFE